MEKVSGRCACHPWETLEQTDKCAMPAHSSVRKREALGRVPDVEGTPHSSTGCWYRTASSSELPARRYSSEAGRSPLDQQERQATGGAKEKVREIYINRTKKEMNGRRKPQKSFILVSMLWDSKPKKQLTPREIKKGGFFSGLLVTAHNSAISHDLIFSAREDNTNVPDTLQWEIKLTQKRGRN